MSAAPARTLYKIQYNSLFSTTIRKVGMVRGPDQSSAKRSMKVCCLETAHKPYKVHYLDDGRAYLNYYLIGTKMI